MSATPRREGILSCFQIMHLCWKKRHVPKSTFLFMEAPQNSYQFYIKEKKSDFCKQCSDDCYLRVVRERITSAKMHHSSVLNVSMNMRFLCFVLLIQETELGLPKRDLMLQ